jgi:hypothetical protein
MQRLSNLVALMLRAGFRATIAGSLAMFAASLFLPFAYGAEIFGVMSGWTVLLVSFRDPVPILTVLAYLASPLSLLAARHRPWLAASLVAFGSLLPIWILATEGLYINAFLRNRRILNSGCLCLLVADLLMLAAWIATGLVSGAKKACPGSPNESRRA